ncbi:MAG: hypothetical protein AAGA92_01515 [Planctomycetota bacterium]
MSNPTILRDRACTACGCLCDDIVVTVEDGAVSGSENLCQLGEQWLRTGLLTPDHQIDGRAASRDEAFAEAASILSRAKAPLVYGLGGLDVDGVRAATELAEQLGAVIAPECSVLEKAATAALQTVGASTATLGEIRHRADTVVLWRADPFSEQPRFWERFIEPSGMAIPGGRPERDIWCVDDGKSNTATLSDHHRTLAPAEDLRAVWQLRAEVEGIDAKQQSNGAHDEFFRLLAGRLKQSRYSAFVLGRGIAGASHPRAVVDGLSRLVRSLNADTRSVLVTLPAAGGLPALQWASGAAGPVDYSSGTPKALIEVSGGRELLLSRAVDVALLVGDGGLESLTAQERDALAETPTIVVGGASSWTGFEPRVRLGTLTPGITAEGQAFRADGLALPLRRMLQPSGAAPAEALRLLQAALAR